VSGATTTAAPDRRERATIEGVVGIAVLLFVVWYLACALSLWRDSAMDDAYITYVYGRHLAEGHGLRFNVADADPTPGSSSLLHVLLSSAAIARGIDPLVATRWLGLACVAFVGLVLGLAAARAARAPLGAGVLTGGWLALGLALLPESITHVAGGMETWLFIALHAACLAWFVCALDEAREPSAGFQLAGAGLALFVMLARPEGGPLALATFACATLARRRPTDRGGLAGAVRRFGWTWGATALGFAAFFGWHVSYFGSLFPNAYFVKTASKIFGGGGLPGLASTAQFVVLRLAPLLALAAILSRAAGTSGEWRRRAWLVVPALLVLASLTRVVREMAGGFRYEFGMLVPFVLLVGIGALDLRRRSRAAHAGVLLATGLCLPLCFTEANSNLSNWLAHPRSPTERWRQGAPQANALADVGLDLARSGLEDRATVLLSGAGQVPYWSKLRAIDWIGLNDNFLSGRDARTLDEVWRYIDERRPDAIVSVLPPAASAGQPTKDDANFRAQAVQRFLGGFASELFERWDRERISEMFLREMSYVREHYEFGVCYQLGARWHADWWIFVYVRRDSPHRATLLEALRASKKIDVESDLGAAYPFDPRRLTPSS
jgi:hypothetical protein